MTTTFTNVFEIPMLRRDYEILMHFAKNRNWFKHYMNSISFGEQGLICEVPFENELEIEEEIRTHLEEVKLMTCEKFEAKDDSKKLIQEIQEKYPHVYLILREKTVEVISDCYEDALEVQILMTSKKNSRKSNRKFATGPFSAMSIFNSK